jgi:hypothetical protein
VIEDVQTSFWSQRRAGSDWDGKRITDPAFRDTCYGWFLDLALYANHAEFERLDGVDQAKVALGQQIKRITFELNIITIEKSANLDASNYLERQMELAA